MRRSLSIALSLCLLPTVALAERDYGGQEAGGRPPSFFLDAGPLSVTLSGLAQVQGAVYVGDDALLSDGDAAENAGFRLRRARFGAEARYKERLGLGVEVDLLESDGNALHEAWVGGEAEYALAYIGLVKVPFSRSALIASEDLALSERPLGISAMAPFQQLGLLIGGKAWDERIRLLFGTFNGLQRGKTFASGWSRFADASGDATLGNRYGGISLSTRLDVEPLGVLSKGSSDLDHSTKPLFGVGGGFLYNHGETLRGWSFSGDLAFKWAGASLLAEYVQDRSNPVDEPTQETKAIAELNRSAFVVDLGYAPIAKRLDVAVQFEMVDENTDIEDEGDFFGIAGAVSMYAYGGHFKYQLFYQHRQERHGSALKNDLCLLQVEGRF